MQAFAADPFDALLDFHRRVERHLATLAALPAHLEAHGAGAESCASASVLLHCFDHECARRHGEEEHELWPRIDRSLAGDMHRAAFRSLRRALASEHRGIEQAWRELRRPLVAVAEGIPRRLDASQVAGFRGLVASHIHGEEAALHRVMTLCAFRHGNVSEPPRC